MMLASGGLTRYVEMLGAQAGGDFAFVDMLWLDPTPRHLVRALRESFVQPWQASWLGGVVLLLAAAGGVRSLLLRHRSVALLLLGFAPYAAFHLLFQETVTTRYALPLLVPVAFLCASGLAAVPRPGRIGAAALVALALIVSVPAAVAYGGDAHPSFRALRDMLAAQPAAQPGVVVAHHALARALDVRAAGPLPVTPTPIGFEWMGAVEYWRDGGHRPVWFLAEPARTDLSLLDPESRSDVVQYEWAVAERAEFGGSRPTSAAWYRLPRPGWFAGPGWSLSLEAGGVTVASKTGLEYRTIEAWVRARPEPAWMLIGGLDLAGPGSRPSLVRVTLGDAVLDAWRVDPAANASFLRTIALPQGVPGEPGQYARLRVSARAEEDGAPTPPIAIRQFNLQSAPTLMFGFDAGWHEEEFDAASRRRWRWTSETSVLRIVPPRDVELRLRGESPLNYFDESPTVRVRAGGRLLGTLRPADDFDWRLLVPADALEASDGALVVETDRVYLPGEAEGTSDARRLGLRLFEVALRPVSPRLTRDLPEAKLDADNRRIKKIAGGVR
jgi:hypothetical protein